MRISELYQEGKAVLSFEFFPPKTDAGFRSLFRSIEDLKQLDPAFVSVTMGAGGSTRSKTVDLVSQIQREIGITAMAGWAPWLSVIAAILVAVWDSISMRLPPVPVKTIGWTQMVVGFVVVVACAAGYHLGW